MAPESPSLPPAGWYPDPAEVGKQRYWTGTAWGQQAPPVPAAPVAAPKQTAYQYPAAQAGGQSPMMGFGTAIATVFRKYADFTGVATRAEYWWFVLFNFLVSLVLNLVDAYVFGFRALIYVWALATILPGLAVLVRRLRDTGHHWGWIFTLLIPLAGIVFAIIMLVWTCTPGRSSATPSSAVTPVRFAPEA